MAKFSYKEHPIVVISSTVAVTIGLCFAVLVPLHNLVVEQKDGTIQRKQADVDSLANENVSLRRRLQGEVVLVSTNDLQVVRKEVASIETHFSTELKALAESLSKLDDIKEILDTSLYQTTPQDFASLRRVANIRPNGRNVNWMGGNRKSGTGIVSSSPSSLSKELDGVFKAFNARQTQECQRLLEGIVREEPEWPYAYFYLGLNSLNAGRFDQANFEKAISTFQHYQDVGITEPEHLLYNAMSHTFVERYEPAQKLLHDLAAFNSKPAGVTLVAVNEASPAEVRESFRKVADQVGVTLVVVKKP